MQHYLAADEAIKLVYESSEGMWKDSLRLQEAFIAQCDPAMASKDSQSDVGSDSPEVRSSNCRYLAS